MTQDEILSIPVGREMDVLVAKHMMNLERYEHLWEADGECSKCRCIRDNHSFRIYLRNKPVENTNCFILHVVLNCWIVIVQSWIECSRI